MAIRFEMEGFATNHTALAQESAKVKSYAEDASTILMRDGDSIRIIQPSKYIQEGSLFTRLGRMYQVQVAYLEQTALAKEYGDLLLGTYEAAAGREADITAYADPTTQYRLGNGAEAREAESKLLSLKDRASLAKEALVKAKTVASYARGILGFIAKLFCRSSSAGTIDALERRVDALTAEIAELEAQLQGPKEEYREAVLQRAGSTLRIGSTATAIKRAVREGGFLQTLREARLARETALARQREEEESAARAQEAQEAQEEALRAALEGGSALLDGPIAQRAALRATYMERREGHEAAAAAAGQDVAQADRTIQRLRDGSYAEDAAQEEATQTTWFRTALLVAGGVALAGVAVASRAWR